MSNRDTQNPSQRWDTNRYIYVYGFNSDRLYNLLAGKTVYKLLVEATAYHVPGPDASEQEKKMQGSGITASGLPAGVGCAAVPRNGYCKLGDIIFIDVSDLGGGDAHIILEGKAMRAAIALDHGCGIISHNEKIEILRKAINAEKKKKANETPESERGNGKTFHRYRYDKYGYASCIMDEADYKYYKNSKEKKKFLKYYNVVPVNRYNNEGQVIKTEYFKVLPEKKCAAGWITYISMLPCIDICVGYGEEGKRVADRFGRRIIEIKFFERDSSMYRGSNKYLNMVEEIGEIETIERQR